MIYIGVDPGKQGGIAVIHVASGFCHPDDHGKEQVFALALKSATEHGVRQFLDNSTPGCNHFAVIEKVHSSPQMGVVSAFTFGRSYGFLRGILVGSKTPFDEVSPRKWQKELGCPTGGDKNVSKAKAQQLFPKMKITHGIADALLLAEYCRRMRRA